MHVKAVHIQRESPLSWDFDKKYDINIKEIILTSTQVILTPSKPVYTDHLSLSLNYSDHWEQPIFLYEARLR